MKPEKRTRVVQTRVTASERKRWERAARAAGVSLATWARNAMRAAAK